MLLNICKLVKYFSLGIILLYTFSCNQEKLRNPADFYTVKYIINNGADAVNEIEYANQQGGRELISGNEDPFRREIYTERGFQAYLRVKGNNPGEELFNIILFIVDDLGVDYSSTTIFVTEPGPFEVILERQID